MNVILGNIAKLFRVQTIICGGDSLWEELEYGGFYSITLPERAISPESFP